jgi:hypothetical protein
MRGVMPVMAGPAGRKPLNTGVAEAAAARVDEALPVQVELGDLLGLPEDRPALQQVQARRGGRPPGAQNKRLAEVSALVRQHLGDVLLHTAAVALMPIDQLMALGMKASEAFAEKRLAAATVLPYLEQRKPLAVDVTGRSVVYLDINIGAEQGEQYQGLDGALVMQLDGGQLDNAAKPLTMLRDPIPAQLIADQAPVAPVAVPMPVAAVPFQAPRPPGGAVFGQPRPLNAPAAVVSRAPRVFAPTRNSTATQTGAGG